MGWFSKKKEVELEEKPEAKGKINEEVKLPKLPKLSGDSQPLSLPSLPSTPGGLEPPKTLEKLPKIEATEIQPIPAIKQAIYGPESGLPEELEELPEPEIPEPPEMRPEIEASVEPLEPSLSERRTLEMPSVPISPRRAKPFMPPKIQKSTKISKPVFIRLDKFQQTLETFEEIKSKVNEIEDLLNKIRETKIKEDQELAEWEREIQLIKSRIDLIDKNIFDKVD